MELLELKSVWDKIIIDTSTNKYLNERTVSELIKQRSSNVLSKVKRVMYLKFFLGSLSFGACILCLLASIIDSEKYSIWHEILSVQESQFLLVSAIIFIAGMLFTNYKAFLEIKRFSRNSGSVKNGLQKLIKIMEDTMDINIYSGAIFNAGFISWLYYVIEFRESMGFWSLKGFLFFIIPVVSFYLFMQLGKLEQNMKFGNYVNQLKNYLSEILEN